MRKPHLVTASDRAHLVVFDDAITQEAGCAVRVFAAWLEDEPPAGLVDFNPAYASVLVRFDPLACDPVALAYELQHRANALAGRPEPPSKSFEIPVTYGGEEGPDLAQIARATGLDESEVIGLHAGADYEVRFIGFLPGFPYLWGLPAKLNTPRKASPRERVPAGSVAIAGEQAGIYPYPSPGGWNVIGRTGFVLFDPGKDGGATLAPGDRVRFRAEGRTT